MNTKPLARRWTTIVLALGAAGAYVFFSYLPGEAGLESLRAELASAQESIQQAETLAPAIEATRQQAEMTGAYVQSWEQSAPTEHELSELFGRINRLAEDSGATTTLFEPQAAVPYDTLCRLPVRMACAGSFGAICRFLATLERLEESIWIDELQIGGIGEDSEDVLCELTLDVFADNPDGSGQVDRSE
jgi:Tfp pilus assembly protein PilO